MLQRIPLLILLVLVTASGLLATDSVWVEATKPMAYEEGQRPGEFTITRDYVADTIVVNLNVVRQTGSTAFTAAGGAATLSGFATGTAQATTVTFSPGQKSKVISITPDAPDGSVSGGSKVILYLTTNGGQYFLGGIMPNGQPGQTSAEVAIAEADLRAAIVTYRDPVGDEASSLFGPSTDPWLRRRAVVSVDFEYNATVGVIPSDGFGNYGSGLTKNVRLVVTSGNATGDAKYPADYTVEYKIGGKRLGNGNDWFVSQPFAYRAVDETGASANVDAVVIGGGSYAIPAGTTVRFAKYNGQTGAYTASVACDGTQNPAAIELTTDLATGGDFGDSVLHNAAVTVNGGLAVNIGTGTPVVISGYKVSQPYAYFANDTIIDVYGGVGSFDRGDVVAIGSLPGYYVVRSAATNDRIAYNTGTSENPSISRVSGYRLTIRPFQGTGGSGAGLASPISDKASITTVFTANIQNAEVNVLVPAESDHVEYAVLPVDDANSEGRETVSVTLAEDADYSLLTPATGSVFIADDDTTAYVVAASPGSQPSTSGVFEVRLTQALPIDVTIPYSVIDDAAANVLAGTINPDVADPARGNGYVYAALQGFVTIKAGDTTGTITVTPLAGITLTDAGVSVTVTLGDTPDYKLTPTGQSGLNPSASLTISRNQGTASIAWIQDGREDQSSPTDAILRVTLSRDDNAGAPATTQSVSVNYQTGGSIDAGRYVALAGQIQIPDTTAQTPTYNAGTGKWENYADVTVTVIDDRIAQGDQVISLTLQSGQSYQIDGAQATSSSIVADNEPALSITRIQDASESGTLGRYLVSFPGSPVGTAYDVDIQADLAFTGSATKDSDYSATTTVTIPVGSLQAFVDVTPIDDTVVESAETVIATLQASPTSRYSLGSNQAATLSLADNEPTITIQAGSNASESGPVAGTFTVLASPTPTRDVTVGFTLSGTATAGTDFVAVPGTVSILAGAASGTISITPIDDSTAHNPNLTIIATISSSTDYTVGAGSSATISITDNDADAIAPTVDSVTTSTANGSYGTGAVISIQVTFSEAVVVNTTNGTPTLTLETGTTDRTATYSSGSLTNVLTFTYTVQAGDLANPLDYASTAALTLNNGTIRDAAGNNAILTLPGVGSPNSISGSRNIGIDGSSAASQDLLSEGKPAAGLGGLGGGSDGGGCGAGGGIVAVLMGLGLMLMRRRRH